MRHVAVRVSQAVLSQQTLAAVRALEAYFEQTTGLDRTLEQALYRNSRAPIGTQRKRHKITDRHARKLRARFIERARFYDPATNFQLGLERELDGK